MFELVLHPRHSAGKLGLLGRALHLGVLGIGGWGNRGQGSAQTVVADDLAHPQNARVVGDN